MEGKETTFHTPLLRYIVMAATPRTTRKPAAPKGKADVQPSTPVTPDMTTNVTAQMVPPVLDDAPANIAPLPHPPLVPVDESLIKALEERNAQEPAPAARTTRYARPIGDIYFTEKEAELFMDRLTAFATSKLGEQLEQAEMAQAIHRIVKSKWALPTDLTDEEATMLRHLIETALLNHEAPTKDLVAAGKVLAGLALKAVAYGVPVRAIIIAPSLKALPDVREEAIAA